MSFFSLLFKNNVEVRDILFEYDYYLDILNDYKNLDEVKAFINKSLNGGLYEWIASELDITRTQAKTYMFKTLFSHKNEFI